MTKQNGLNMTQPKIRVAIRYRRGDQAERTYTPDRGIELHASEGGYINGLSFAVEGKPMRINVKEVKLIRLY